MVEGDDGVEEHEESFRYVEDIFHGSSRFGLEVADAVVAHIANGTAGKRREYESWDCSHSELRELFLEEGQRVAFRSMAETSLENLSRIWTRAGKQCRP